MSLFICFLICETYCTLSSRNPSVVFLWSNEEIAVVFTTAISSFGGPNRDRTDDLTDANRTLSHV